MKHPVCSNLHEMFKGDGKEKLRIPACFKSFIDIKRTAKGIWPVWFLALQTFIKRDNAQDKEEYSQRKYVILVINDNVRKSEHLSILDLSFLTYPDISQQEKSHLG